MVLILKNLSFTLRLYRTYMGYTQDTVSNMLHITRQAYANYENGIREPSLSILKEMAYIFNTSVDTLLHSHFKSYARSYMEIERKYLLKKLPDNLTLYKNHKIEQGYLCTDPVIRIRRQDEQYFLTYKSKGLMMREEYNLPLNEEAYKQLLPKIDGIMLEKTRYLIPLDQTHTIELDVFEGAYKGLCLAEVEFQSEEEANNFTPPDWFGEDVTFSTRYHNSTMSKKII